MGRKASLRPAELLGQASLQSEAVIIPRPGGYEGRKEKMIQYSVILKRYKGSSRPDVVVFQDEDREKAISEMKKYVKKNGFTVYDRDGRFTIETVALEEKEPIAGSPVPSLIPYHKLFDHLDNRLPEE